MTLAAINPIRIFKVLSGSIGERVPNSNGGIEIAEFSAAKAIASKLPERVGKVTVLCNREQSEPEVSYCGPGLEIRRFSNSLSIADSNSASYSAEFGRQAAEFLISYLGCSAGRFVVEHTSAIASSEFLHAIDELDLSLRSRILSTYSVHNSLFLTDRPEFIFSSRPAEWQAWRKAEMFSIRNADIVICPSGSYLEHVSSKIGGIPGRSEVIPNTVGPVIDDDADVSGRRYVLFMGRLAAEKRVDLVIRAFRRLPDDLRSRTALVLCGNGPERGELSNLAASIDLTVVTDWPPSPGSVCFLGSVTGGFKELIWRESLVHLCPSELEVSPVVGYEGLRFGVPAITSDVAGWLELISTGDTGYSFPLDGWDAAASEIVARLVSRRCELERLASTCRMVYSKHYTPEKISELRLKRLYEPFIEGRF